MIGSVSSMGRGVGAVGSGAAARVEGFAHRDRRKRVPAAARKRQRKFGAQVEAFDHAGRREVGLRAFERGDGAVHAPQERGARDAVIDGGEVQGRCVEDAHLLAGQDADGHALQALVAVGADGGREAVLLVDGVEDGGDVGGDGLVEALVERLAIDVGAEVLGVADDAGAGRELAPEGGGDVLSTLVGEDAAEDDAAVLESGEMAGEKVVAGADVTQRPGL